MEMQSNKTYVLQTNSNASFRDNKLLFDTCKVLNICMDCFMLDVTNVNIKKEDCIYVLNKYNPLKNYANYLKISEYQVMCNLSKLRANRLISVSNCENKQN